MPQQSKLLVKKNIEETLWSSKVTPRYNKDTPRNPNDTN